MDTINVFEEISLHIISYIRNAEYSIKICVPWLTDIEILQELIEKSKVNVKIEILTLNDEFNRAKLNYYNRLTANGSKVYLIDKSESGGILHSKFCIVDDNVLINGSYNWSKNAKNNDENIAISIAKIDEEFLMINEYQVRFVKLLYKYDIKNENDEWDKVSKNWEQAEKTEKIAGEYYDLAISYLKDRKLNEALNAINIGIEKIEKLPISAINYYFLKYLISCGLYKYVDAMKYLLLYLSKSSGNKEIERFKEEYYYIIREIKSHGKDTFLLIDKINSLTKSTLGSFASRKIEPHFFTYSELDVLDPPF